MIKYFSVNNKIDYNKIFNALIQNLIPTISKNINPEMFQGKMETFLTCLGVSENLRGILINENAGNFFEETALQAIYTTLSTQITPADLQALLEELPKILKMKYPVAENIREVCIEFIPQFMNIYRLRNDWITFTELDYILKMLRK